jgi:hypothetical protein
MMSLELMNLLYWISQMECEYELERLVGISCPQRFERIGSHHNILLMGAVFFPVVTRDKR